MNVVVFWFLKGNLSSIHFNKDQFPEGESAINLIITLWMIEIDSNSKSMISRSKNKLQENTIFKNVYKRVDNLLKVIRITGY